MTFDPKCLELVKFFLEDEPALKADEAFAESLAQEVQLCLEDSIELRKSELKEEKTDSPK